MKKLVMAMAIIGTSMVYGDGAKANWDNGYGDLYEYGGGGVATGYVTYFFNAATLSRDAAISALGDGDWATVIASGFKSTGLSYYGIVGDDNVPANFAGGSYGSAYLVVFNSSDAASATYAYVSEQRTSISKVPKFIDEDMDPIQFTFSLSDSATASNWTATTPGPEPIPEPTSGLLMLLGVAGLALKRKRA